MDVMQAHLGDYSIPIRSINQSVLVEFGINCVRIIS